MLNEDDIICAFGQIHLTCVVKLPKICFKLFRWVNLSNTNRLRQTSNWNNFTYLSGTSFVGTLLMEASAANHGQLTSLPLIRNCALISKLWPWLIKFRLEEQTTRLGRTMKIISWPMFIIKQWSLSLALKRYNAHFSRLWNVLPIQENSLKIAKLFFECNSAQVSGSV